MRELIFRAKRLGDGEWIEGNLFIDDKGEKHEILIGYVNYRVSWEVDPATVGQFIGLTDKNGTRIFEGDILRRAYHPNDDVIVEWHDGRWAFRKRTLPKEYGHEAICCTQQTVSWLRVIGNIHDNPELIGERKDND